MKTRLLSVLALLCSMVFAAMAASADGGTEVSMSVERSVMIPTRDGHFLSTDLYMPGGTLEKRPTILIRTMYGKKQVFGWDELNQRLVDHGYVVAVQDIRGRFESTDRYRFAERRREDGIDTLDWIIEQPWSNGKIGTRGCSYQGEVQLPLAATRHPSLVTATPFTSGSAYYHPGRPWTAYNGGVLALAYMAGFFAMNGTTAFYQPPDWVDRGEWFRSEAAALFRQDPVIDMDHYLPFLQTLPTATILERAGMPPSDYHTFVGHMPDSEYFRNKDWVQDDDRFSIPALFSDSWYDYGVAETLELFRLFRENADNERAADNQFLIIGPTTHCGYGNASENTMAGERNLGDARLDYDEIQFRWFEHWMKGVDNGVTDMPKIQYYLMGKNEWRHADVWPVPGSTPQRWYLGSSGSANSSKGNGTLSRMVPETSGSDSFTYDPADPVPSLGGHSCCTGLDTESGAYDQSEIELRDDILVFTSPPLEQGIEATGAIKVMLHVSSSAVDTDFTAKLIDVYPDGRAFNVQEGALRMRYRDGMDKEVMMEPGHTYPALLDLYATSNYFGPGHRIRLEISSSNFPILQRNLNTGGDNHLDTHWISAQNTVYHGPESLSYLELTVVAPNQDSNNTAQVNARDH